MKKDFEVYKELFLDAAKMYHELHPNEREVKPKVRRAERFFTNGHIVIDVDK